MGRFDSFKKQVLDAARGLAKDGLLVATGGNVSMRIETGGLAAITPSTLDYFDMSIEDICVVNGDCELVEGTYKPSFETDMHLSVYRSREDVNAIIHTHQVYASVFSLVGKAIPALFDEQVVNLGSTVEMVPYGLSGSAELKQNVVKAVASRCNAFILQNHGCLVMGTSLASAVKNAHLLEKTARAYHGALLLGEEITRLPRDMEELLNALMINEQDKEIARKNEMKQNQVKKVGS